VKCCFEFSQLVVPYCLYRVMATLRDVRRGNGRANQLGNNFNSVIITWYAYNDDQLIKAGAVKTTLLTELPLAGQTHKSMSRHFYAVCLRPAASQNLKPINRFRLPAEIPKTSPLAISKIYRNVYQHSRDIYVYRPVQKKLCLLDCNVCLLA